MFSKILRPLMNFWSIAVEDVMYYFPVEVSGIQIFSGIRSIQDIMLLPLEERPADPTSAENVSIPAQEL